MDGKSASNFLNATYPVDGGLSDMMSLLGDVRDPLESTFLPAIMLVVPQSYITRNQRRVDICGTVDESTQEYQEGYRFYSSVGELFYGDGRCLLNDDNPCDLVSLLDHQNRIGTDAPPSPYIWVHPRHWVIRSWFNPLVLKKRELVDNNHYLNRMGLVVRVFQTSLVQSQHPVTFTDDEHRSYTPEGKLIGSTSSMFDLVSEIKHWPIFQQHDWSTDQVVGKKTNEPNIPELFDPTVENRPELMSKFFAAMTEVNDLADRLGMELGFHMKTL